jgi:hypothetical protein
MPLLPVCVGQTFASRGDDVGTEMRGNVQNQIGSLRNHRRQDNFQPILYDIAAECHRKAVRYGRAARFSWP